jgi:SAM-dependent methyltransferase
LIPFVAPGSGSKLRREGDLLVSEADERFPVVAAIPRFVASEGYASSFGLQWTLHRETQLDSRTGKPISRERLERCLGQPLSSLRGVDVLEAGCGAGRFTELLVAAGAGVHAVDLSHAVEANRANVGDHANYVVAQADILELPFPSGSFDVTLCLGVLQHLPNPEQGIEALWTRVKPGGLLVIDHYRGGLRPTIGRWTRLSTLYRLFLRRLPPQRAKRITDAMVDLFFPLHWTFRRSRLAQIALNRFTGCPLYYDLLPDLSEDQHREWSRLDAFDTLTDRYKHLRTAAQIRTTLTALGGSEVWAVEAGNGVEARARKPRSSNDGGVATT